LGAVDDMTYLDKYRNRMNAESNAGRPNILENSIELINKTFNDSPTFREILVNGELADSRVISTDDSWQKFLLFRPMYVLQKGTVLFLDNESWIVVDFSLNNLTPRAKIYLLNEKLTWKNSVGSILEQPCFILSNALSGLRDTTFLSIPNASLTVVAPYNGNTSTVKLEQAFVFGKNTFKTIFIDDFSNVDNGKGFITFLLESSVSNVDVDNTDGGWL
jgi:hypothetical protein